MNYQFWLDSKKDLDKIKHTHAPSFIMPTDDGPLVGFLLFSEHKFSKIWDIPKFGVIRGIGGVSRFLIPVDAKNPITNELKQFSVSIHPKKLSKCILLCNDTLKERYNLDSYIWEDFPLCRLCSNFREHLLFKCTIGGTGCEHKWDFS